MEIYDNGEKLREIKTRVSMRDVIASYGLEVTRAGFIPCPFHREKTASCKIYSDKFCCFGCSAKGDVLDFVSLYENVSLVEAEKILDLKFRLGLFEKPTPTKIKQAAAAARKAEKKRAENENRRKEGEIVFEKLCEYRKWLVSQPQTEKTEFDTDYIDRQLDAAAYDIGLLSAFDGDGLVSALKSKHVSL